MLLQQNELSTRRTRLHACPSFRHKLHMRTCAFVLQSFPFLERLKEHCADSSCMCIQAVHYGRLAESWGGQQIYVRHELFYWRCVAVAFSYSFQSGVVTREAFASERELQDQVKKIR